MEDSQQDTQEVNNQNNGGDKQLDSVKERALKELVPLLGKIDDIDPERKFDICISALRYTDDKDLANMALDVALSIKADGPKAEALVNLINEINYLQKA